MLLFGGILWSPACLIFFLAQSSRASNMVLLTLWQRRRLQNHVRSRSAALGGERETRAIVPAVARTTILTKTTPATKILPRTIGQTHRPCKILHWLP